MNKPKQNIVSLLRCLVIVTVITVTILISYPPYSYAGLIIWRGECSAKAFEQGAEYVDQGNIQGLSVNYTTQTSNKNQYNQFLQGIDMGANPQYCVATDDNLTKKGVKITLDPIRGNLLHAKLSGKSKDIALALTRF
jgi:hypothetical protein